MRDGALLDGFDEYVSSYDEGWAKHATHSTAAGIVANPPPFLSQAEDDAAEEKIDRFMAEVLIPIAESSNAIVVCDCLKGDCFLSSSFLRVMDLQRGRWAGTCPITVLSFSCDLAALYHNPDLSSSWRELPWAPAAAAHPSAQPQPPGSGARRSWPLGRTDVAPEPRPVAPTR